MHISAELMQIATCHLAICISWAEMGVCHQNVKMLLDGTLPLLSTSIGSVAVMLNCFRQNVPGLHCMARSGSSQRTWYCCYNAA